VSHNRHQQQREILELTIFPIIMIHRLIFQCAAPLASLFFISLPPLVMFELMIVFVLVFLVIVPLCNPAGNLWNLIGEANSVVVQDENASDQPSYISEAIEAGLVSPPPGEENLNLRYSFRILVPIILLCVLVVCVFWWSA